MWLGVILYLTLPAVSMIANSRKSCLHISNVLKIGLLWQNIDSCTSLQPPSWLPCMFCGHQKHCEGPLGAVTKVLLLTELNNTPFKGHKGNRGFSDGGRNISVSWNRQNSVIAEDCNLDLPKAWFPVRKSCHFVLKLGLRNICNRNVGRGFNGNAASWRGMVGGSSRKTGAQLKRTEWTEFEPVLVVTVLYGRWLLRTAFCKR
jgi:hypothetical protein